jgi:cystathionine beta-lyase/cystathionine gamma-synthase
VSKFFGGEHAIPQALLEESIANLENAEAGLAVASGMTAISSSWTLLRTSPTYRISDSTGTDGSEMFRCGDSLDFLISMIA